LHTRTTISHVTKIRSNSTQKDWHPRDHQHPNYNPAAPPLTLDIPEASGSGLSRSFSQDPDLSPFVTPRHYLSDSESEDSNEPEQLTRTPLVLQAPVLAQLEEEEAPLTPGGAAYLQILQQATDTSEPEALQLIEEAIEEVVVTPFCFLRLILSGAHYRLVLIFRVYLVLPAFATYWTSVLTQDYRDLDT